MGQTHARSRAMSCNVVQMSCRCRAMSCKCRAMSCKCRTNIVQYRANVVQCREMSCKCREMSCNIVEMSCNVVQCRANVVQMSCNVVQCRAMSCNIVQMSCKCRANVCGLLNHLSLFAEEPIICIYPYIFLTCLTPSSGLRIAFHSWKFWGQWRIHTGLDPPLVLGKSWKHYDINAMGRSK